MQVEEPRELRSAERANGPERAVGVPPRPARAELENPRPRALEPASESRPKGPARRPWLVLLGLLLLGLTGFGVYTLITAGRESTDDAQVAADLLPVSARVGGLLQSVAIHENQSVKAGDLIAQIDPAEYQARLRQAEGRAGERPGQAAADADVAIVTARSTGGLSSARAAYSGSSVGIASADAELAAAQAGLVGAEAEAAQGRVGTRSRARARCGERHRARGAGQRASRARLGHRGRGALQGAGCTAAQGGQARGCRAHQRSPRARGQSEPIAGADRLGECQCRAGARPRRQPPSGARARALAALVHEDHGSRRRRQPRSWRCTRAAAERWAAAGRDRAERDLRGRQLQGDAASPIRAGQRATIEVDAYPGREFEGKVLSISGGTGASFALLPADNASGNFVKVVQRVPCASPG
jgi:membrane fusion protein (multidrug efflux system)